MWYYFRVKAKFKGKAKFNIVNLKKSKTLYTRGMKPYYLSYLHLQRTGQGWQQGGN